MWHGVLGAEVGVDEVEFKVLLQNRQLQKLPLFHDAWIGDYPDPYTFCSCFHSTAAPQLRRLFQPALRCAARARVACRPTPPRAIGCCRRPSACSTTTPPIIPLYYYATRHLVKPYLRGWQSNIVDRNLSRYMYLLEHHGS